jgi:secreted trypsin-like serine protease
MNRPAILLVLIGCIYLSRYSVQATVFSCNASFTCGCSRFNADINARIVGGETAANHSWGWAVSLRDYLDRSICGASIISRNYILTAAHCVEVNMYTPNLLSVVVGADTINSRERQNRSLTKIFIHPQYNQNTKENDIAILYLSQPIDLSDVNVAKICLPAVKKAEQSRYPIVKKPIVAIGWGRTSSGGVSPNALRQVTVNTVDSKDKTCKGTIQNSKLQFCAAVNGGGKGKSHIFHISKKTVKVFLVCRYMSR